MREREAVEAVTREDDGMAPTSREEERVVHRGALERPALTRFPEVRRAAVAIIRERVRRRRDGRRAVRRATVDREIAFVIDEDEEVRISTRRGAENRAPSEQSFAAPAQAERVEPAAAALALRVLVL